MQTSGFGRLDAATGGFEPRSSCLLYGPRGSGKTAFCLSFLHQGLSAGERAALITAARPEHLLQMAGFFGWDLRRYMRQKQLTLLEYPEDIEDMAASAEPAQVVAELRQLLGNGPLDRLVMDPITPLVESAGVLPQDRLRAVIDPLAEIAGVALVVVNGERERMLGSAKDMVDAVLRFAPPNQPGGPRYLRLEKHRGRPQAAGLYRFVLEPDNGFIDAAEAEAVDAYATDAPRLASIKRVARAAESPESLTWRGGAPPPSRPAAPAANAGAIAVRPRAPLPLVSESEGRLLLIEPDGKWRSALRQELQRSFTVVEACGAADAAQFFSNSAPDAIVLSLELDGESGIELISRLRQNGWNLPIIATCRARTNADHLAALAAGADHCLSQPIDGRILRLTVFNSLCRLRNLRAAELPALPAAAPASPTGVLVTSEAPCTDDLNVLYARLQREISHGRQHGVPFVLLTMRSIESSTVTDLACSARTLLRATDVLLIGARGIACLLAELPSADGFLDSFAAIWTGPVPQLKRMRYEGQDQFLDAACAFLTDEIGATVESAWLTSTAAAGVAHG